nr:MAG TPA: hypothetical protein [Caudoviricetes sp.]
MRRGKETTGNAIKCLISTILYIFLVPYARIDIFKNSLFLNF